MRSDIDKLPTSALKKFIDLKFHDVTNLVYTWDSTSAEQNFGDFHQVIYSGWSLRDKLMELPHEIIDTKFELDNKRLVSISDSIERGNEIVNQIFANVRQIPRMSARKCEIIDPKAFAGKIFDLEATYTDISALLNRRQCTRWLQSRNLESLASFCGEEAFKSHALFSDRLPLFVEGWEAGYKAAAGRNKRESADVRKKGAGGWQKSL